VDIHLLRGSVGNSPVVGSVSSETSVAFREVCRYRRHHRLPTPSEFPGFTMNDGSRPHSGHRLLSLIAEAVGCFLLLSLFPVAVFCHCRCRGHGYRHGNGRRPRRRPAMWTAELQLGIELSWGFGAPSVWRAVPDTPACDVDRRAPARHGVVVGIWSVVGVASGTRYAGLRCGPPSSSSALSRRGDLERGRSPRGTLSAGLLGFRPPPGVVAQRRPSSAVM